MAYFRLFRQYFAIVSIALAMLVGGCSSDDAAVDPATFLDDQINAVPAPDNLMGIWAGVLVKGIAVFDAVLVFHFPDGAEEGRVVGVAVNRQTDLPYLLIDTGYMAVDRVAHPEWDFDYLIGSDGSQGTKMKRFAFANKLVSQQAGVGRLSLDVDTLTGSMNFEGTGVDNLGVFEVVLKYWDVNQDNTATLAELAGTWHDPVDDSDLNDGVIQDLGWDDTSTEATLVINDTGVLQPGSGTDSNNGNCSASGPATILDVAGHNLFLFADYVVDEKDGAPRITLSGCGSRDWNPSDTVDVAFMDGTYDGIGVLYDDNGTDKLFMILTSSTHVIPDTPGTAIFNEFTRN